jgi:adenylate cyclase
MVSPATPGDRRIVTALFADIVDYSRLVTELDAEEVVGRIDEAFRLLAGAVERYEGVVEKFIGDAVFAVFGARRAHDDDPLRAALCSLAMTAAMEEVARARREPALRLRVGIATGEVVAKVREVGDWTDLVVTGDTVTTAMRLQELAEPGETLLDDATVRAARQRLEVEVVGEHVLRGRAVPVRVHRLRGERLHRLVGAAGPGLLIGRAVDRARLRAALETTRQTGRGRVVLLVGEAGIGKSRLAADVEEEARGLGFAWTWTENLSYTTGEYYAFARTFAQRIADEQGIDSGTFTRRLLFTPEVDEPTWKRLAGAVAAIARDAEFSGWEAEAALAPVDPARVRRSLAEVTDRYVRRLAKLGGPRAIVIDDVHWADRSSRPLLDRLIRIVGEIPFVIFVTTRPGGPVPNWAPLPHVEVIELAGLDEQGTARLAASVAGSALGDDAAQQLHARTGGNPLFIVETVRALLEDDALVKRGGRLELVDQPSLRRVPVNLRALLGARIDMLPVPARAALQVASVIGMTFSPHLVVQLLGVPSADEPLATLVEAAIVDPGEPGADWRFRHPLIRDVGYAGMLSTRRRELHARLADSLEERPIPPPIGQLAHHRAASGDSERAVPLLAQAAEAALLVGATSEAADYWRTAAALLGDDPAAEEFRSRIRNLEPTAATAAMRGTGATGGTGGAGATTAPAETGATAATSGTGATAATAAPTAMPASPEEGQAG